MTASAIAALFSEDVEYRYHPYDEPIRGREAVVEAWLGEGETPDAPTRDERAPTTPRYRAVAVDGDLAVAVGDEHLHRDRGRRGRGLRQLLRSSASTTRGAAASSRSGS